MCNEHPTATDYCRVPQYTLAYMLQVPQTPPTPSPPPQSHRHYRCRDKPTPVLPRFPNLQEVKDKSNPDLTTDKVNTTAHRLTTQDIIRSFAPHHLIHITHHLVHHTSHTPSPNICIHVGVVVCSGVPRLHYEQ